MNIDVKRSFRFAFEDSEWIQKLVIGGLFFFGAFVLNFVVALVLELLIKRKLGIYLGQFEKSMLQTMIYGIIDAPILAFAMGYIIKSAHNEIKGETPLLPEWGSKFFDYFKTGITYYLINWAYYLAVALITFFVCFILGIILRISGVSLSLLAAIGGIIGGLIGLVFAGFAPFVTMFYAENFNWKDAFRVKDIISAVFKDLPDYVVSMGILVGLGIIWFPVYMILTCTCIGAIIPQFLIFMIHLIVTNLFAQTYKQSMQITPQE